MATLHKEYIEFNKKISLSTSKRESLMVSRNSLKGKIRNYFKEEKPDELQPKFHPQGSIDMKTTVNPIIEYDDNNKEILKYDLDYGIYFIENEGEDNKQSIETWHEWVYDAVKNHTSTPPVKKNSCIRVMFSDGHHVDLPIYYKCDNIIELAHKIDGFILSDPKEFIEWFNNKVDSNEQLRRLVKYFKSWKNFKIVNNSNRNIPSGFALTILIVDNYVEHENDDDSFLESARKIKTSLDKEFQCLRPTTPVGEDVLIKYSEEKRNGFLAELELLIKDCQDAKNEKNFKTASEILRKQFGERFPLGEDESEEDKSDRLKHAINSAILTPKPYAK